MIRLAVFRVMGSEFAVALASTKVNPKNKREVLDYTSYARNDSPHELAALTAKAFGAEGCQYDAHPSPVKVASGNGAELYEVGYITDKEARAESLQARTNAALNAPAHVPATAENSMPGTVIEPTPTVQRAEPKARR